MENFRHALERLVGFLGVAAAIVGIIVGIGYYIYLNQERLNGAIAVTIIYAIFVAAWKMYRRDSVDVHNEYS